MFKISVPALLLSALPMMSLADAPFGGTVYTEPDIITDRDPSVFAGLTYHGTQEHEYFADCNDEHEDVGFHHMTASFTGGAPLNVYVNTDFGSRAAAQDVAQIYSFVFGQMPKLFRKGIQELYIEKTGDDWCASTGEIFIHHGNYAGEKADGALEESMMHETAHAALDDIYATTSGWKRAQRRDDAFLSDYGASSPEGEDLAETIVLYYGLTMRPERLDADTIETIEETTPARLDYLRRKLPKSKLGL